MNELIELIQQIGFPAAMCFYFIFKTEKAINNNTKVMNEFKDIISKCHK